MGFKRQLLPESLPSGESLTRELVGIGFVLSGRGNYTANIEDTLLAASIEAMSGDYRTLGLLVQWIDLHLPYVNADRLVRLIERETRERVRVLWAAVAQWQDKDKRFSRLKKFSPKARVDLLATGSEFQIRRRGEDARFAKTCLRVPNQMLRIREGDVLAPRELARKHVINRHRVMMGPTYRSDMWAWLELHPDLTSSALARLAYGSFATAWGVIRDRRLIK